MLSSAFKYFGNLFGSPSYSQQDLENELDKLNSKKDEEHDEYQVGIREAKKNYKKIIGKITEMGLDFGTINGKYTFKSSIIKPIDREILRLGSEVTCTIFRQSEDHDFEVDEVLPIEESQLQPDVQETIEELQAERPECFFEQRRHINGSITDNVNDTYIVDNKITFNLQEIEYSYIPRIYDLVTLLCLVNTEETFTGSEEMEIKVLHIEPLRIRKMDDEFWRIVSYNGKEGLVDNGYIFYSDALEESCRPRKGDKVIGGDLIEILHPTAPWRFVTILIEPVEELDGPISILNHKFDNYSRNGISINQEIEFEISLNEMRVDCFHIKNTSKEVITFLNWTVIGSKQDSQIKVEEPKRNFSFEIAPGDSGVVKIVCCGRMEGTTRELIKFYFKGVNTFFVKCAINISVNNCVSHLGPIAYSKRKPLNQNEFYNQLNQSLRRENIICGIKSSARFMYRRVKAEQCYDVPKTLFKIVLESQHISDTLLTIKKLLPEFMEDLSVSNYGVRFHYLIHLEQIAQMHAITLYNRKRVHFKRREGDYLVMEIENLLETRPSLALGDRVKAINSFKSTVAYVGVIDKITQTEIYVKFNSNYCATYNFVDVDVEFEINPNPFRRQHLAIQQFAINFENYLIPTKVIKCKPQLDVTLNTDMNLEINGKELKWFNKDLNEYQKKAVKNVLRGEGRPLPYIVFGPPGTGKTITVIEIILQLFFNNSGSRLLIGTPSNSAANLIVERIIKTGVIMAGQFIRLVSYNSVERDNIPDHILPHCVMCNLARDGTDDVQSVVSDNGIRINCSAKEIALSRLVIGTLGSISILYNLELPKDHFTHVIIDEAGQCTEPDTAIPLEYVSEYAGQIVLAGDPKQLGPVVVSDLAKNFGLDESLILRFLNKSSNKFTPYARDVDRYPGTGGFNEILVTKLLRSYRAIPSILKIYSDLFYDSDLIAHKNDEDLNLLKASVQILRERNYLPSEPQPNDDHGLYFVGVLGREKQLPESPSWYNPEEVNQVTKFTLALLKIRKISPNLIGIVTPYQMQVRVIRSMFQTMGLSEIPKVGSAEEFQGQERPIILVSTVRVSKRMINSDRVHNIGFVSSAKRMNVAISRGRALVVVFGDPYLLQLDDNWKKLITYCKINNAASGYGF